MNGVLWWARRLASGKPHQVIGERSPYMLRWWLIPRNRHVKVYVHKFVRSDDDRAMHDHPWGFVSLVLRGAYLEQRPGGTRLRQRGSVAYRPATTRHIVHLINELPCWTLVVGGPKVRDWGFWCETEAGRTAGRIADLFGVPGELIEPSARFVPWQNWDDAKGCGDYV